jgi:hypothetical protein
VTLFHSARVLEPGEYETGGSFVFAGSVAQDAENTYFNQLEPMILTTPPVALFVRSGWENGINTGAYLGLPFVDFFVTKQILEESEDRASYAITGDISFTSLLLYNDFALHASVDIFKSNYNDNGRINPFIKLIGGYKSWSTIDLFDGYGNSGSVPSLGITIGNESQVKSSSYMIVSVGIETIYGNVSWADGPISVEISFNISLFMRK